MGSSDAVVPAPSTSSNNNLLSVDLARMRYEEQRLSTFHAWPSDAPVEARKIAKAGFFHTGAETTVQCSWCGCVIDRWNYGDQVRRI